MLAIGDKALAECFSFSFFMMMMDESRMDGSQRSTGNG
jgi:hypothetical protein